MSRPAGSLGPLTARYDATLEAWWSGEGEAALEAAYEVGREALAAGVSVVDVVAMHRASARRFQGLRNIGDGHPDPDTLLLETLVPYEMALRGYRHAAEVSELNTVLERHAAALEQANAELESFASTVSHDLRSPLRKIEGYTKLLEDEFGARLDETGREYLARVRKGVARMGSLIDDILLLARVSRAELKVQEVDLSAMAERDLAELAAAEPARVVRFRVQPGLRCHGDPTLLGQVMDNLIGNAWKFTRDRAEAHIEVGRAPVKEEREAFLVRDDGVGFDMSLAPRLFRPFSRLVSTAQYEGTGVGLSIVKRVVQRHGGSVWAESTPGGGATFYFTVRSRGR